MGAGTGYSDIQEITADTKTLFDPFPLTEMQQAQWLGRLSGFSMSNVAAHVYLEMEGKNIDVKKLQNTWHMMILRHDMLRVIILPDGSQQIIENPPPYKIKNLDLQHKTDVEVYNEINSVRQQMDHQVRPIDKWPLFEVRTTQLPGNKDRIHFSIDLIICDIASLRMLLSEWARVYEKADTKLRDYSISFRDYVLAEKKLKETETYKSALRYWDKRIPVLPSEPKLPFLKNPDSIQNQRFKRFSMRLDTISWNRLKSFGTKRRISPSIILMTAFAKLLTKWSKSQHFCINTTIINRLPLHEDVEHMIGEFASFAPMEIDNRKVIAFEDMALRLQKQNWEVLENRAVHGVTILRKLAQQRGGTSGSVLPVVFTSTIVHEVEVEDNVTKQFGDYVYLISQTPQVWLDHTVMEDDQGLLLSWHVVEEIFPPELIDTMWNSYEKFIRSLAANENLWSLEYNLIPSDQQAIINEMNEYIIPIPGRMLYSHFFDIVKKAPNQPAIISDKKNLTYGELGDIALRIACYLETKGIEREDIVAIVMQKGWESIAAALGILKAGGAYLPIDPEIPEERRWFIIKNSNCKHAFIQPEYESTLKWPDNVCVYTLSEKNLSQLSPISGKKKQPPGDLAYVIYTSGTTGVPKGVMITHDAAINTIDYINHRFQVHKDDRVLALSEMTFDLSVYDVFGLLSAGGTIVIPRPGTSRDPDHWQELVEKHKVTIWNTVPALMAMFINYIENKSVTLTLRLAMLSGDWIPVSLPDRIKQRKQGIQIISLGGATEGSIWSIMYPVNEVNPHWKSIPYGRPLANQKMYVLNDRYEFCPFYVPGKLYIAGRGLFSGYLNSKAQTENVLFEHPFTKEMIYETGDIGCYRPDGTIEFLGREDFQVKISGYRIELGEIELVLNNHNCIKSAIVHPAGKSREHKRLVAYVIFKENSEVEFSKIISYFITYGHCQLI